MTNALSICLPTEFYSYGWELIIIRQSEENIINTSDLQMLTFLNGSKKVPLIGEKQQQQQQQLLLGTVSGVRQTAQTVISSMKVTH